jgi:hypothetical protein
MVSFPTDRAREPSARVPARSEADEPLAKRNRGSRSAHRPGGQAPVRTAAPARPASPASPASAGTPPTGGTAISASTQLDAAVATTNAGQAARPASPASVARSTPGRAKVKPNSLLAARAADEYVYIGADLRRIAIVAAGLISTLLVLWLVLVVANISGLY